ncbi:MAG: 8-oxoguanine deaminase [Anaerolineae bacterium]|nr:8-oxoguanine deaminase [Anaerolineae bacterium]MDW8103109.1 8-oxoguanine deaminase [Anaerolineae bacterium]
MPTLLLRHADLILPMDDNRTRLYDGAILVRDNFIEAIGPTKDLPSTADIVIDASGMIVLPGLVNTHHHLYQTLTRVIPETQNAELFDWLVYLYPIWARLTGEAVYISALIGMAELLLSGCTTTTDHLYLFPNDVSLDDEIRAAREIGIRFHPCRGSMSLGRSKGGLPPDEVVQSEDEILADCERLINTYHDPSPGAMCRIALAPCSPFSVTPELMRETAQMARRYNAMLHTHLAETLDEENFCLEKYGMRPLDYMAKLGWLGEDVWFVHVVHVNSGDIKVLAETGSGVAHCPTSNMRLGSGISPIVEMLKVGVKVGLAVDGSASNDSSHMLAEARQALLLQRVRYGASSISAEDVLELATRGGAKVLGRDDIGSLEPGKAADFIGIRLERLEYAGASVHDPVASLIFCSPVKVDLAVVNGKVVVEDGNLLTVDLEKIVRKHNSIARKMVRGE